MSILTSNFLKGSIGRQIFISSGTIEQELGAKIEIDLVPYVTILRFLLYNSFLFLRENGADGLIWNTSFIICKGSPFKKKS